MRLQAATAFLVLLVQEGAARLRAPDAVAAKQPNATSNISKDANVSLTPGEAAVVKVEVVNVKWTSSQVQRNHSTNASSSLQKAKAKSKTKTKLDNISAALKDVEDQIESTNKELLVQATLVHEKDNATKSVQREVKELRDRAEKLRKEADVAVEIGKEKDKDALKSEKDEKAAESKAKELEGMGNETKKFFNQTQTEERVLEKKAAALRKERQVEEELEKAPPKPKTVNKTQAASPKAHPAVALAAAKQTVVVAHKVESASNSSAKAAADLTTGDAKSLKEAMQKLLAENQQLKREKEELARKLAVNRASQEKALLKRKLKNRLVQKDRKGSKAKAKTQLAPR